MATEKEIKVAKEKIEKAIIQDGPYSHNIVGLVLSGLNDKKAANKLIDEFELDELYGIQKVGE